MRHQSEEGRIDLHKINIIYKKIKFEWDKLE